MLTCYQDTQVPAGMLQGASLQKMGTLPFNCPEGLLHNLLCASASADKIGAGVAHLDSPVLVHKEVGGLQVTVDDRRVRCMQVVHALGSIQRHAQSAHRDAVSAWIKNFDKVQ